VPDKTVCTVQVTWYGETYEIDEIDRWDYSSDILAVGDECHFTVINDNRKYTGKLPVGATVKLYLSNPNVNGGAPTLRHLGIIVARDPEFSPQTGSLVKVTSADLGWHLTNSCAPLWYNLRHATYRDLLDPAQFRLGKRGARKYFLDPSWGLKGVRASNNINRSLKQGVAAAAVAAQQVIDPVFAIQVEAGDMCFDKMVEYARRLNLLVNVSVDGYIQAWNPDYSQAPSGQLRCVAGDTSNNVLSSRGHEDCRTIWTDIECVGEQVGYEGPQDPNNPNAKKKRGAFYNRAALPFVHRLTFGDGEMFQNGLARREAEWRYKRGIFDSWWYQYQVADHWQELPASASTDKFLSTPASASGVQGVWWEADTMVDVQDDEEGLSGVFYVASVRQEGSRRGGDLTTVVIRKPNLLTASFGEMPNVPIVKASPAVRASGKTQSDSQKTTVVQSTPNQTQSIAP